MSDFTDKNQYTCTELRSHISELYDSLMNMAEEIYRLEKCEDRKFLHMILAENVSIEIKEL